MSAQRLEWKVGLFVLVCLVLLAAMMVKFSKGLASLGGTYEIILTTSDVGGVQENAAVRMAGVKVGQVRRIDYDSTNLEVVLHLAVQNRYQIPANSLFTIETAGFLGEQYIAISPQEKTSEHLAPGARVPTREPFNLQEAARSAMQLIRNVDGTVTNLNIALTRVDRTLLSEESLSNVTAGIANFRQVSEETLTTVRNFRQLSERAESTVSGLHSLVETNSPAVSGSLSNLLSFSRQLQSVTNLVAFSEQLNRLGADLREVIATNRADLTETVQNIESASSSLKELMSDLQAGKGLAGRLLKSPELDSQTTLLISNLTVVSSNLARFGLLYRPKPPKTPATNAPAIRTYPGRTMFDR
jgi:phospholipid/cholesterol/gamma-HCH transport system substrate-binding protein